MKIQKQMRFHLPIEVVKGLESFVLVFFYAQINMDFCF